jgi:Zn-finger nucleic acid-binding protein
MCNTCQKYLKICPCCGEIFYDNGDIHEVYNIFYNPALYTTESLQKIKEYNNVLTRKIKYRYSKDEEIDFEIYQDEDELIIPLEPLFLCPLCSNNQQVLENMKKQSIKINVTHRRTFWRENKIETIYIINPELGKDYIYPNLKIASVDEYRIQLESKAST